MQTNETILTEKQIEVLKLRAKGHTQEEIAKLSKTTKQNIHSIEKMALRNLKRAENTVNFMKLLKAPIWFSVDDNTDLETLARRIYKEANEADIHIKYDAISLLTKIREEAMDKVKHRLIIRGFEVGITNEGDVILI
ncbi:MAG: Tfx family DNA-binding protein [Halobacteriota archaeon]|nr:Tfx family DNA-binding protein [Halobacteriota archaeon]